jgi:hypothetical protein
MKRMKLEADLLLFQRQDNQMPKMEASHGSGHWANWKNGKQNQLLQFIYWI